MNLSVRNIQGYKVVDVNDSAKEYDDLSMLKTMISDLIEGGERFVAVNVVGVDYVHSFFIKIITSNFNKLKRMGGDLCIIGPNKFIKNLLNLLNINEYISIFEDEKSFRKYLMQ